MLFTTTWRSSHQPRSDQLRATTIGNARAGEANTQAGQCSRLLRGSARATLWPTMSPVPGGIDITFKEPVGVVGYCRPAEFPHADSRVGILLPPQHWQQDAPWCSSRAELTPFQPPFGLGELALEAGIPEGPVYRLVPGKGSAVGQRFVDNPNLCAKSCSTQRYTARQCGEQIMAGAAPQHEARDPGTWRRKSANVIFSLAVRI